MVFATLGMDKVMGHPRGSGFVKFSRGEDAEKCVKVREGCFKDHDQMILDLGVPEEMGEVEQKQREKEPKDIRNNRVCKPKPA